MRRFCILLLLTSWIQAQSVVGEFSALTSILNVRDLIISGDKIYAASPGGLVEFDRQTAQFQTYGLREGLTHVNLLSLARDPAGRLWLGIGEPRGEINIWDPERREVVRIHGTNTFGTNLTAISAITFSPNRAFVAYQRNVDWGIFEFQLYSDSFEYRDFYQNFPLKFSYINDLRIIRDTLWVATNVGLLYVDIRQPDLKVPTVWNQVDLGSANNVPNVISAEGRIYTASGYKVFQLKNGKAVYLNAGVGETINSLFATESGELGLSCNRGVFVYDQNNGWYQIGTRAVNRVQVADGVIWGGSSDAGLWCYRDGHEHNYIPNTPLDNIFTALWVTADGRLVAGTNRGISFQTAQGWYNIRKDYFAIKIHSAQERDWRYFVADTIAFSLTNRLYSLVQRKNGDFFASLYGAYLWGTKGGGLLRFNSDRLSDYVVYDTTEGKLAGSAGRGGADNFLGIGYLALDEKENLWIINQYAQNDNVVAVLTPDEKWYHFSIDDSKGYLSYYLTSIAFDPQGRVWFGSEAVSSSTTSPGGIIVLDYNRTLGDKSDDRWYYVSTAQGLANNSVYALAFDKEGELWIMSAGGIQQAQVNNDLSTNIFSFIEDAVLSNLPFSKECRIRVDGLNNKWITTVDAGVKVYTYNGTWLNDVEGFTVDNSKILSNSVLDIAFYSPEGLVYLATNKGISVYKSPYAYYGRTYRKPKVFPSPYQIPNPRPLIIDGLLQNSEVKIMLLDGTFIRHLTAARGEVVGQQAFWDGRDHQGKMVSSGVYIFLAYTPEGDTVTGKLAVVRK